MNRDNDIIKVVDISKTFGSICGKKYKAVDNVSFGVKQGEILCILGPNGGMLHILQYHI